MRVLYFGNPIARFLNLSFIDSNVVLLYQEPWRLAGNLASALVSLTVETQPLPTSANVSWLCSVLMGLQTAAEYGLPVGIDGFAGNMLATSHGYLFPQPYSRSPVTGVPRPGSQEQSWLQLQKLSPYHQVPRFSRLPLIHQ